MKEFFVVLCVTLALISVPVSPQDSVTEIDSPSDLNSMTKNGDYVLTSDIDMSGETYAPPENFTGTFDGQGHTIYDLEMDPGSIGYGGLFRELSVNAEITNVTLVRPSFTTVPRNSHGYLFAYSGSTAPNSWHLEIRNVRIINPQSIVGDNLGDESIGIVAGNVKTSMTVENVTVRDVTFNNTATDLSNFPDSVGAFGSVGYDSNDDVTFRDITIDNVTFNNSDNEMGGVVGSVDQDMRSVSFNDITVKDSNFNLEEFDFVGGVTGRAPVEVEMTARNIRVEDTRVYSERVAGGVAGGQLDEAHDITVTNTKVIGEDFAGGVMSRVRNASDITFDGKVHATTVYAGGLAAVSGRQSTIENVRINGSVTGPQSGGILGRHYRESLTIEQSRFKGQGPKGGLIGSVKPSSDFSLDLNVHQSYAAGEFDAGFAYNVTNATVTESHFYGDMDHEFSQSVNGNVVVQRSYHSLPGSSPYLNSLSTEDYILEDSFNGWNFSGVWVIGKNYPTFGGSDPIPIYYDSERLVTNQIEGTRNGANVQLVN